MAELDKAALYAKIDAKIDITGNEGTTGAGVVELMKDIIDSYTNKINDVSFVGLAEHDPARTYKQGTGVFKDNKVYKLAIAETSGAWNAANWTLIANAILTGTYEAIQALVTNSALRPGFTYYISDSRVWLTALDVNRLSPTGYYLAKNPDFGNISGNFIGVWHDALEGVAVNKLCAWNGYHYKNLTGGNGYTNPAVDNVNWLQLAKTDASYITEIDECGFDFDNEFMFKRADKRGNIVVYSYTFFSNYGNNNTVETFQWGNDVVYGNVMNDAYVSNINHRQYFVGNTFKPLSEYYNNDPLILTSANTFNNESKFTSNTTTNGAKTFARNTLFAGISLSNKTLNYQVTDCTFGVSWEAGYGFQMAQIGKSYIPGFSNFEHTLAITGLTTLSIFDYRFAGIINLTSSNASETVGILLGMSSNHEIEFRPEAGLTVTFTHGTVDGNDPHNKGAANKAINGDNKDWIRYKSQQGSPFEINIGQY